MTDKSSSNYTEIPVEGKALEEIGKGMMYASLAITDNNDGTLKAVKKANPWQEEALRVVTGSRTQAHKHLDQILAEDMGGMVLDHEIDVRGVTKGGHFLDTQGYIAHNDHHVVLAFRCTTSAFDWLTNFNTTSSAWEIEEDLAQGFSGFCSGLDGICCVDPSDYKPRVHTGFYNNFLGALPAVKEHITPLLEDTSRPRTLYVVGHSLGAGVATLAACYFLTEHDWGEMPHSLVVVTAGSPRACTQSMKSVVDEKIAALGPNNARMYRIVKGQDVVATVPPKILGFRHLNDPIMITDEERIVLCQDSENAPETIDVQVRNLGSKGIEVALDGTQQNAGNEEDHSRYDRLVKKVPKPLRDHMPDFYLKPILKAMGLKCGSTRPGAEREYCCENHYRMEKLREATINKMGEGQPSQQESKNSRRTSWKMFGGAKGRKSGKVQPVA